MINGDIRKAGGRGTKGNSAGMSLIEMMIAMLVGMILLAGIYRIFMSTNTSYNFEAELSSLQENGRFAMEFLSKDVRMTGYRGCVGRTTAVFNVLESSDNILFNFNTAIEGFDNVTDPSPSDLAVLDDPLPVPGADVLVLRMQDATETVYLTEKMSSTSAAVKINNSATEPIEDDDIVMITDCEAATIFQVNNITYNAGEADANLVHNAGGSDYPGNAQKDLEHPYDEGAELIKMSTSIYFIGIGVSGRPSLYLNNNGISAELVGDIETMQITYGVDTNDDLAIDDFVPAGQVTSGGGSWDDVLAVRIGLLASSAEEVPRIDEDNRILDVNGFNFGPANDRRLRQVFTTTIVLRNRLR